jgi:tripartite-type tricarboxylate transporter receptor subunit TctC
VPGKVLKLAGHEMQLPRRKFLALAAGAAALPAWLDAALALDYPTRPVHLIVGFPAGFTPDIIARLTSQMLSERLGKQIIVDNRPGAASNIGTELVVRALPDGYTLLGATGANAINATLYENLTFNFINDIVPVASIVRAPLVMTVNPSVPAETVLQFIAYAKTNKGKINMASGGIGSTPHVAGELFNMMLGLDLVHVPYRANLVPDLLAGQVQLVFAPIPTVIGYVKAGKLRALAVTSTTRVLALPDTPTMTEFVPGYEASTWFGIGAPKGVPAEIVVKLNKEANEGLADAQMIEHLTDLGSDPIPMTPDEFGKLIADETAKWAKVIRTSNIKPE